MNFNKNRMGLAIGSLFATMHFLWILVVAFGIGNVLVDEVISIHFFTGAFTILDFSLAMVLFGIIGAFVSGYVMGWIFACFWNLFGKDKEE